MVPARWKPHHLSEIQKHLERINQFKNLREAFRGERAFGNKMVMGWIEKRPGQGNIADVLDVSQQGMKKSLQFAPSGFFYYNLAFIHKYYRQVIEASSGTANTGSGG